MHKNINKVKSAILSGMIAASSLAGSFMAFSPSLSANAAGAGDDYAKLLQYSLYFYDANMCGKHVDETSKLSWRANCHTSDEVDGGFHDAGDHVKFGLPAGYSASVLGLSYHEFGDAFDSTGQTAHLKTITDYFAAFFKNSTTLSGGNVTNFVYQIGDGGADHAEWCAPEMQGPSSRKTFSTSSGASDIAAEYAAALAANYVNFGNEEDLTYAKALFNFSTKYNQKATEGVGGFYDSWDYYDDQAWAAGWLYLATKDNTYKSFLNTYMNSTGKGSSGMDGCQWGVYSTLSWNNVSMGAAMLQAEITGDSADWKKVTDYVDKSAGTSDYHWESNSQWGSARYQTAQQTAALVASKYNAKNYYSWAKGQMDYIMGNKGVGSASPTCFVVGLADNSAKYAHHRAASGYSSFDEMGKNTGYSSNGHVLVGALVGGPTSSSGTYNDSVQDYTANEVTLDYNATLVAAAAGLYAQYKTGSAVDPSTIPGVTGGSDPIVTDIPSVTTTIATTVKEQTTTTVKSTDAPVVTTTVNGNTSSGRTNAELSVSNGQTVFNPNNADEIEITFKITSSDTEGNGCLGYSDAIGNWTQIEYKFNVNNGKATVTVDGTKLKGVNSVQLQVWWPQTAEIESVVLINNSAPAETTTKAAATTKAPETTTTKAPETTTTAIATTVAPVVTTTVKSEDDTPKYSVIIGDANGDGKVSLADSVAILQFIANSTKYPLTDSQKYAADVDGVPGITGSDALMIQKFDAGAITAFPTK